jgi:hypothetical protein
VKYLTKLALAALTIIGLSGCAPSNPEDVLKAGPETTANYIADALASGDGEKLCILINQVESGRCEGLFDSVGLAQKPEPKIEAQFAGAVEYTFEGENSEWGSYLINFVAIPYKTESGSGWQYRFAERLPSIENVFGIKYDGQTVEANATAFVMPGSHKDKVEVLTDSANWFSYDEKNREFKVTDKAIDEMTEIVTSRCIEAQKTEAPTKENIRRFADENFRLTSITQIDNCKNLGEESIMQMTPTNMTWSVASSYEIKGYETIRFWGDLKQEFTVRQGFSSNWSYQQGKWVKEDYDFYGG